MYYFVILTKMDKYLMKLTFHNFTKVGLPNLNINISNMRQGDNYISSTLF